MDVIEAIKLRKSIRGYKPDPVPKGVLKEILEIATRAPSAENMQPWEIAVIAGEVLEKIKQANIERYESGAPAASSGPGVPRTGKFSQREVAVGIQLFELMNIGKEDRQKKIEWAKKGIRFFDAPAAIIISTEEQPTATVWLQIGALAQTIALAALNYGLGTCIAGQGVRYHDIIRRFTGIPESQGIIIGVSIGYPDWEFPANKVYSEREPIENMTIWCGR